MISNSRRAVGALPRPALTAERQEARTPALAGRVAWSAGSGAACSVSLDGMKDQQGVTP
jgi:hypothetical protein